MTNESNTLILLSKQVTKIENNETSFSNCLFQKVYKPMTNYSNTLISSSKQLTKDESNETSFSN